MDRTMTREIDRKFLFEQIRGKLFAGGLKQSQVEGIEAILDAWEDRYAGGDGRWLAYGLATAYHETAFTMQPVRETLARSDAEAAARLEKAWAAGRLSWVSKPYWRADAEGKYWFGRGLVQITHRDNYLKLAQAIGRAGLVVDPGEALRMDVAIDILFTGMEKGLFTGRKLSNYFGGDAEDWANARRIINGLDRAADVAGYGRIFYRALGGTT